MHTAAPPEACVPRSQGAQAALASRQLYVPAAHGAHGAIPTIAYVPAVHSSQAAAAAAEEEPASHRPHVIAPAAAVKVDGTHGRHAAWPLSG